jgi:hypothetical protein
MTRSSEKVILVPGRHGLSKVKKDKVVKPKKRAAGKKGAEWSSEEEQMAKFSTVRSRKKTKEIGNL